MRRLGGGAQESTPLETAAADHQAAAPSHFMCPSCEMLHTAALQINGRMSLGRAFGKQGGAGQLSQIQRIDQGQIDHQRAAGQTTEDRLVD